MEELPRVQSCPCFAQNKNEASLGSSLFLCGSCKILLTWETSTCKKTFDVLQCEIPKVITFTSIFFPFLFAYLFLLRWLK